MMMLFSCYCDATGATASAGAIAADAAAVVVADTMQLLH